MLNPAASSSESDGESDSSESVKVLYAGVKFEAMRDGGNRSESDESLDTNDGSVTSSNSLDDEEEDHFGVEDSSGGEEDEQSVVSSDINCFELASLSRTKLKNTRAYSPLLIRIHARVCENFMLW